MKYIYWKNDAKVMALTTTRIDGLSKKPFNSLNLAYHVEDVLETVSKNRLLLLKDLDINPHQIVYTYQSHSDITRKVTSSDAGRGGKAYEEGIPADALYTLEKELCLAVFHADCVPIFVYVKKKHLVMIIHAGEKGTLKEITFKAIQTIIKDEKVNPRDIEAYIGPSRQFMHYPCEQGLVKEAIELGYHLGTKKTGDTYYIDLPLINYLQLKKAGVLSKNISMSSLCTFENNDLFFSYKRENKTGRMLSLIQLRK